MIDRAGANCSAVEARKRGRGIAMVVEAGAELFGVSCDGRRKSMPHQIYRINLLRNTPAHCEPAALAAPATNHRPPWWGLLSVPRKKKLEDKFLGPPSSSTIPHTQSTQPTFHNGYWEKGGF